MKKVRIKYNPYRITTDITVDGKAPKSNSHLNVTNFRLQEWIERLPQILIDEYRDCNFEIEFIGTEADYNDVVAAIEAFGSEIKAKCTLNPTLNIDEVEASIDNIFAEIQANDKVPELQSPAIREAFMKAKNSRFEINVVAPMSSGKSTLINALLGQQLMPAKNEATTATIVKIVDSDNDHFTAVAYDKSGNIITELDSVTIESMDSLNDDERIQTIELKGKIPFVKTTGMNLVLVDTPGPNNSRDKRHEAMTYSMLADSDKSLVLFVMNSEQLGINDEKIFLDYICQQMSKGGKQSRERFLFAVNKMDRYKPWPIQKRGEGVGCIPNALSKARIGHEERGILNPNIFPVASLPALQLRELTNGFEDDEEFVSEFLDFKKKSDKYEEMHLEKYYNFSNLPISTRHFIDGQLERLNTLAKNEKDEKTETYKRCTAAITEIHTGIVSIEQAISMYVNKYARTQKIKDLVDAFNGKLEEMATIATLQDEIANDKKKAEELSKQIGQIKANIESARKAMTLSKEIDKIDLSTDIRNDISFYINTVRNQISKMEMGEREVDKDKAMRMCKDLEIRMHALSSQIKIEINKILDKAYKSTLNKIISEYKKHLANLNIGLNASALTFNPANLVSASLGNLSQIIEDNTDEIDEGEYVWTDVRVEGGFFRKTASFLTFGAVDDHTWERKQVWEEKLVEVVDMAEVSGDYLNPFRQSLNNIQRNAIEHVSQETTRLKDYLQKELIKIDKVLDDKLNALSRTEADSKAKATEIAENENKLQWLKQIQQKIKNLIEF